MDHRRPYIDDSLLYCAWKSLSGEKDSGRVFLNLADIKKLKRDESSLSEANTYLEEMGIKLSEGMAGLSLADKKIIEMVLDHLIGFDMKTYDNLQSLPVKDEKKLRKYVNDYINDFINDRLTRGRGNFYNFSEQKRQIFYELVPLQEQYGENFVLEYPDRYVAGFKMETNTDFLFIHSLIALESLGYLKIEDIWIYDAELPTKEQSVNYKVKLTLGEKYFDERRKTGKLLGKVAKEEISFDADTSTLFFRNTKIVISKTRNKGGHFLLSTVFKDKKKIWEYDEIAEDWDEEYEKDDWRKYYNAGYSVNEKVAKQTTVADFLVMGNKTICINKKYL